MVREPVHMRNSHTLRAGPPRERVPEMDRARQLLHCETKALALMVRDQHLSSAPTLHLCKVRALEVVDIRGMDLEVDHNHVSHGNSPLSALSMRHQDSPTTAKAQGRFSLLIAGLGHRQL